MDAKRRCVCVCVEETSHTRERARKGNNWILSRSVNAISGKCERSDRVGGSEHCRSEREHTKFDKLVSAVGHGVLWRQRTMEGEMLPQGEVKVMKADS